MIDKNNNYEIQFRTPTDLMYDASSHLLYIASTGNDRMMILDDKLNLVSQFGKEGKEPGEFNRPSGIAKNKDNHFIIAEAGNNRVQILDEKYDCLKVFEVGRLTTWYKPVQVDSKNNIYINDPGSDTLFTVYNSNGEVIERFGEIYKNENSFHQIMENRIYFTIDDDQIYCIFSEKPTLRKYDANHDLVYEIELNELSEIQYRKWNIDRIRKYHQEGITSAGYTSYMFTWDISHGENHLYVPFTDEEGDRKPIYVFDKDNGEIVQRIYFKYKRKQLEHLRLVDFSSDEYIYAMNYRYLYMFKK